MPLRTSRKKKEEKESVANPAQLRLETERTLRAVGLYTEILRSQVKIMTEVGDRLESKLHGHHFRRNA